MLFTAAAFVLFTALTASAAKAPVTCEKNFEKVGCFKRKAGNLHKLLVNDRDTTSSAHQGHVLNWKKFNESIHSLACRCEEKAKSEGLTYFGIAFWAECYGGNDEAAITKLLVDNESIEDCKTYNFQNCIDSNDWECIGRRHSEYVYKVGSGDVEVKIDGGFSEWGPYGVCSQLCRGGTQERSRTCSSPAPEHGGADCEGEYVETRVCNENECPVDGVLSEWGPYGDCSKVCGGGMQSRRRTCTPPRFGGRPCEGDTEESRACNEFECPVDGKFTAWGPYGKCSKECGGGTQIRYRACIPPRFGGRPCDGDTEETRACNEQECPVDGKFTAWGPYGKCSKECNGGTQVRYRACIPPKFGGKPCEGKTMETRACNQKECPIDGKFTAFGPFGKCSKKCGGGTQSRRRTCIEPKFGGKPCQGNTVQTRKCNQTPCPVDGRFKAWGPFGKCSKACNGGTQSRKRYCIPPRWGGKPCQGKTMDTRACNTGACQVKELTSGIQRSQASQSTLYMGSTPAHAYNAIDGNTNTDWGSRSCTHTNGDKPAWWRLDLLKPTVVKRVIIWNRSDCCSERLSNFVITVGNNPKGTENAVCARGANTRNIRSFDLNCPANMVGRYVQITIPGPQALTLCEVKVYGYNVD